MPELTCLWNYRAFAWSTPRARLSRKRRSAASPAPSSFFFEVSVWWLSALGLRAAAVAVGTCWFDASWFRGGTFGDTAREGRTVSDDGEDRSQGCTRHRPVDPDGLV